MAVLAHRPSSALGDAAILVAAATLLGLGANALRPDGLPLVPDRPPQVLVPCPEPAGDAEAVDAGAVDWAAEGLVVLDARPADEYAAWHAPGARSLPYDFLEPVDDGAVAELAAARGIVVYGDGGPADTGEQLARELSARGLRGVRFVRGGAAAVRAAREAR